MSNISSPYHGSPYSGSGYASPVSARSTPPPGSKPSSSRNTPKPVNVFTNDGSFLERIQRSKKVKEEEQKRKELEAIETKKNFDSRFRNRGKRSHAEPAPTSPPPEDHPSKKPKPNDPSKYSEQLKSFENRAGLKDTGTGIRPLVR